MQYLLTEDELRALKAQNDVEAQAKILVEDYRERLSKAVFAVLQPFLLDNVFGCSGDSDKVFERLRAVFLSVPAILPKNKV